jgi:hypothetical protein
MYSASDKLARIEANFQIHQKMSRFLAVTGKGITVEIYWKLLSRAFFDELDSNHLK